MKLALGLDVQTNAKAGKFIHRGLPSGRAGVQGGRGGAVGARQLPGRQGQEGGRVLCEQHRLELWTDGVEQAVIDDKSPFRGPPAPSLEPAAAPATACREPAEFARRRDRALVEARHVWLMARQWGVLFERHLMLEPLEAPCCPLWASSSSELERGQPFQLLPCGQLPAAHGPAGHWKDAWPGPLWRGCKSRARRCTWCQDHATDMALWADLACVGLNADVKFVLLGDFRQLPAVLDSWAGRPISVPFGAQPADPRPGRRVQARAHGEQADWALAPEASKLLELEVMGCYESVPTQNGCNNFIPTQNTRRA